MPNSQAVKERPKMTDAKKSLALTPAHSAQVLHTSQYDKFNFLKGNRPINPHHVQDLIMSFEERPELIELQPIHCNEKMEIVDGQHRMVALQTLELPVPYTITPGLTIGEAQLLNALQKPWTLEDYARSYAAAGNQHYQAFNRLAEAYTVPLTTLMQYAGVSAYGDKIHRNFKLGRFEMNADMKLVHDRLEKLVDFTDLAPGFWNSSAFSRAFLRVLKTIENYDHDRMIDGAMKMGIRRHGSQRDYLLELERAYNFRKREDVTRFI